MARQILDSLRLLVCRINLFRSIRTRQMHPRSKMLLVDASSMIRHFSNSFVMLSPLILLFAIRMVSCDCAADNCLRAFRSTNVPGRLEAARSFCATYTSDSIKPTSLPTYATESCKDNINGPSEYRISSACRCIDPTVTQPSPRTTHSTTSYSRVLTSTISPSNTSTALSTSISSLITTSSVAPTEACGLVSKSAAIQRATRPLATPTVAASLAYECLNSVPLGKQQALDLVESMVPYIEWQSDIVFKKDPPSGYLYPSHDIFDALSKVKAKILENKYFNEYEFQTDLYDVFLRGHDGHFIFYPDALTKAFDFNRRYSLVSISRDGNELPQIKLYEDVLASPSTAPAIAQINGIDAAKFIADLTSESASSQDPDAGYNSHFFERAFIAAGISSGFFAGGGRLRYVYPGPNTTLTFDNGTTAFTYENVARVLPDFRGVTDGKSFYQRFCTGSEDTDDFGEPELSFKPDSAFVPGYPIPVVATDDDVVSGYYLNGTGIEDVAVLSLLAFQSESPYEFQQVVQKFIASALRDQKKKLVIDLSANGGGYILQGYDLFRQLFPQIFQDGFTRTRASDTFLAIAAATRHNLPPVLDPSTEDPEVIEAFVSIFNYHFDLNITNQPFETFESKFGPKYVRNDSFTNIIRWDLDDPYVTTNEMFGIGMEVTGYGTRKNFTQPFRAENIIMLTDGVCASTCALFSEFMRTQAGVKVIAMGGRPQPGLIQAIGGVKGAQVLQWSTINYFARQALKKATSTQAAILRRFSTLPLRRSRASACNTRDNILPQNLPDGTPAQFIHEPADCRLFYTAPMISDVTRIWEAAADAAFNGGKCFAGGIDSGRKVGAGFGDVDLNVAVTESEKDELDEEVLRRSWARVEKGPVRSPDAMWTARHGRKLFA